MQNNQIKKSDKPRDLVSIESNLISNKSNSISIIIPTLNEQDNVNNLARRIDAVLRPENIEYELIFIDDHSKDNTLATLEQISNSYPLSYYLKKGRKGKAYSLLEGFEHARYDLVAMIDADLQYPPEAIPEMIKQIESGTDIIVANRKEQKINRVRKFISKSFTFLFGRLLHGLNCDVQSGLKVFRKQIIKEIKHNLNPTGWTFDLGFLIEAKNAGYNLGSVNIKFDERRAGHSTINIVTSSLEIGLNALALKFKNSAPYRIFPIDNNSMAGAGIAFKGKRFITHSTLPESVSAFKTFTQPQKMFIFFVWVILTAGLAWNFFATMVIFMAILSAAYFIDVLFNIFLVIKSLRRPPEISITRQQIDDIKDDELPTYTILCPLFRESMVLPEFIKAIENIEWPRNKLDVLLLLEQNDHETIQTAQTFNLPSYMKVIVVPHSLPKTKPKACNYGLAFARGEYLVIYDAEDQPEPDQLKKSYLAFKSVPNEIKCIQAKLNYFNPEQNLLTRLFTLEYSLWFDIALPGLQSINTSIPLGGTSNHFRTADLINLRGWDPFNVTEDCDLGIRLFKNGYKTAILNSTTFEEANSRISNWLRQRSRWIKGYIQTYLVHMRRPMEFLKQSPFHFLFFQLNVGGKIAFMFINPILWATTIGYFTFRAVTGPVIEQFYPSPILYIGVFSLVFGNFLYLYCYMIGCAKREQWPLIKYVFLVPFYWLLMSVASVKAIYELAVKPHFWQKTSHGLYFKREKQKIDIAIPKPEILPEPVLTIANLGKERNISAIGSEIPKPTATGAGILDKAKKNPLFTRGAILIFSMLLSNAFNFLFNAFLGRKLSLSDLGLVTLVNTLWYLAGIFINSISSTVNHRAVYLSVKEGVEASKHFWKITLRLAVIIALVFSVIWLAAIPLLSDFFQIEDKLLLLLFTPTFLFGVLVSANRGFLQSNLMFHSTAIVTIVEAGSKLAIAMALIYLEFQDWVFISIPGAILFAAMAAFILTHNLSHKLKAAISKPLSKYEFPKLFYAASVISSVSSAIFLSLDIILVKHYLDPVSAGAYALLSLVGKMIYFFGSLPSVFMITFVARAEGLGKKSAKTLHIILSATIFMVAVGFISLGWFGDIILPFLFGDKVIVILEYVRPYIFAISLFTITSIIISYHLAKKQYIFPVMSLATSVLMAGGIIAFHNSIVDIVQVITIVSIFGFLLIALAHLLESRLKYISSGMLDFLGAFTRTPLIPQPAGGKRVLIFNWRDMNHVFFGGAEVYIHEIAKRLATSGNYVTIFCGNDGHSARNEIIDGINIFRRGGFYLVYLWAFIYYFTKFRGRYDIIIDCHNGIPFFTPMFVKEPIICVVHHIHQNVFRHSLPKPMASFACFLERDLMPLAYRNTHFVTVSPSSKAEMIATGLIGKGINIVYSGVDLVNFKPAYESPNPTILYLGRLKAYKSIDVLIAAFKILLNDIPDAQLIIAGSGEEENHLKRFAEQIKLSDQQIIFAGKISHQEKINFLQKSWVMVNPSFMEGWGITTIEANACGTPVIASDIPGLRDSIKNLQTGYLVKYGDSEQFANKIKEIIMNHGLRQEMQRQSRLWAENFSWTNASDAFSSLIKENHKIRVTI